MFSINIKNLTEEQIGKPEISFNTHKVVFVNGFFDERIRAYDAGMPPTDFAILLGADENMKWYIDGNASINNTLIMTNNSYQPISEVANNRIDICLRPTLNYRELKNGCLQYSDYIVIFGEYPQIVIGSSTNEKLIDLEKSYQEQILEKTGKTYTFNANSNEDEEFIPDIYDEYLYKGNKYIRYTAKKDTRYYESGKSYWVLVQPIKWHIKKDSDIMLPMECLITGISAKDIGNYLKNYFIKDIISSFTFNKDKAITTLKKIIVPEYNQSDIDEINEILSYYFYPDSVLLNFKFDQILEVYSRKYQNLLNNNDSNITPLGIELEKNIFSLWHILTEYYKNNIIYISTLKAINEFLDLTNKQTKNSTTFVTEEFSIINSCLNNLKKVYEIEEFKDDAENTFNRLITLTGINFIHEMREFLTDQYNIIVQYLSEFNIQQERGIKRVRHNNN